MTNLPAKFTKNDIQALYFEKMGDREKVPHSQKQNEIRECDGYSYSMPAVTQKYIGIQPQQLEDALNKHNYWIATSND